MSVCRCVEFWQLTTAERTSETPPKERRAMRDQSGRKIALGKEAEEEERKAAVNSMADLLSQRFTSPCSVGQPRHPSALSITSVGYGVGLGAWAWGLVWGLVWVVSYLTSIGTSAAIEARSSRNWCSWPRYTRVHRLSRLVCSSSCSLLGGGVTVTTFARLLVTAAPSRFSRSSKPDAGSVWVSDGH